MSRLVRSLLFMVTSLAILALQYFVIGPNIRENGLAVAVYMGTRVLIGVGLGYLLTRYAERNRFQSVSSVVLVFLVDQVAFKGLWALQNQKVHPELWDNLSGDALVSGLASGFVSFMPVILVIAFVGTELGLRFRAVANGTLPRSTSA